MKKSNDKMLKRYLVRTVEHIHRVQNNMVYLLSNHMEQLGLNRTDVRKCMHNVMKHDLSKFSEIQFEAYIELTEFHYQRKRMGNVNYKYPEGVKKKVCVAINNHYLEENHHPKRMGQDLQFSFSTYEAIETICDLQALAQEFNEKNCKAFFEDVWVIKHKDDFSSLAHFRETTDYMKRVIECFEEENIINFD